MKKARLFKRLEDGWIQCLACLWYCRISPGETGLCGVRENRGGRLNLLTYSKASVGLDPIEKKPLYHFLPGTTALSFGTLGCNFGCLFCQNSWASQSPKKLKTKVKESEERRKALIGLIGKLSEDASPESIVSAAVASGAKSIAYTYTEPAVFVEYAHQTMVLAKKAGLKNVFVSNGFESKESFNLIKDYLDGINIDLKSFKPEFYQQICKGKLEPVLKNIEKFYKAGIWLEVTTLLIDGENDSDEEIRKMARFLKGISPNIPWHFSAFAPAYKMKNKPATPTKTLIRAKKIAEKEGINFVYLGNAWNLKGEYFSTYCPQCKKLLIERDAYRVAEVVGMEKGRCVNCQRKIEGRWQIGE